MNETLLPGGWTEWAYRGYYILRSPEGWFAASGYSYLHHDHAAEALQDPRRFEHHFASAAEAEAYIDAAQ